jgi:GntR family transcriptional regulator
MSQHDRGAFARDEPKVEYYASLTGSRHMCLEASRRRDIFAQQIEAQGKTPKQVSTIDVIPATRTSHPASRRGRAEVAVGAG